MQNQVEDEYEDPVVEAARTALSLIEWDGHDPRPVVGLVFTLADELRAAGHSYESIEIMLHNIANSLKRLLDEGEIE